MILSAEPPSPERFQERTYATTNKSSIPPATIDHTDRTLECFNLTTPRTYPIDVADCQYVIDGIFHDPAGVMQLRQFSNNRSLAGIYFVPADWDVGRCTIILRAARENAVDTFRLADVILKAQKIIDQCPPNSKRSLGGIATIGHRAGFYVAVNGPSDIDRPSVAGFTSQLEPSAPDISGLVADPNLATIDKLL